MLTLEEKKAVVVEVAEVAKSAHSVVAAEYAGLTVAEMTDLRRNARNAGVYMRVVKNTLARRALENTPFACMSEGLAGPLILAFSKDDPGSAARVVSDFAKTHQKMVIRLVALEGKLFDPAAIGQIAKLPTKQQALSMLAGVMKAPVVKLVRTLVEPHAKLTRAVAAIRDSKQAA